MDINFTKAEILSAIKYLEAHPKEIEKRQSSTYDLIFEGRAFPPILVLSKANQLKGGKELLLSDFNNNTEKAFEQLRSHGFQIDIKSGSKKFSNYLKDFLTQANESNLKVKRYSIGYMGTNVKASFGQGASAKVPWISFLMGSNTTSKGISPVYLYYKEQNLLVLAFGVSEEKKPNYDWGLGSETVKVKDFFKERNLGSPFRYGDSFIYKVYEVGNLPPDEILDEDLESIIMIYAKTVKLNLDYTRQEIQSSPTNSFNVEQFKESLLKANLVFNENLIKRFVASLLTKPFVILTGLAGSGKTKLAQSFIQWISQNERQYLIVPVGADWINREPMLGYPNGLDENYYVTPDNGLLELLINASKTENQNKPFFIVLDEMNLSHVERYFADFLSIMESNAAINLYSGGERFDSNGSTIPNSIFWPKNLFIIGTVNIDETTYMFSPKVLDRANVIEFRLNDSDLVEFLKRPKKADLSQIIGMGASMGESFVKFSNVLDISPSEKFSELLVTFFNELKSVGAEFGYRSALEMHLLISQFSKVDTTLSMDDKIDFAIMQKLLPKLHGSRSKIINTLEALMKLCLSDASLFNVDKLNVIQDQNIKYRVSFDKLKRMYFNALSNGFTSYAEA